MKNLLFLTLFAFALIFQSCGSNDKEVGAARLNHTWVLEEIDGQDISTTGKAPTLTFNSAGNTISGNGGCNSLNGSLDAKDANLQFGAIASTKMSCPNLQLESQFLEKINNQPFDYEVDGNKLVLRNSTRTLTFKKAS